MTYKEAMDFIEETKRFGSVLGLATIRELLQRLDNPQEKLKIIHIAGTNGKGSTGAFISSILSYGGYKVGRYISPAVFSYLERIQISEEADKAYNKTYNKDYSIDCSKGYNNDCSIACSKGYNNDCSIDCSKTYNKDYSINSSKTYNKDYNIDCSKNYGPVFDKNHGEYKEKAIRIKYISREAVTAAINRIKPICQDMIRDGFHHPTTFEIETAMTFLYLLDKQVDYLVLEVGMGGGLDATNIIRDPICTAFTSISMDHMEYLGDSLEKIAYEKSGIIKPQSPVITIDQRPEVLDVLRKKASESKSTLIIADSDNIEEIEYRLGLTRFTYPKGGKAEEYAIKLMGNYQIKNAILAIEVARKINNNGCLISEEAIWWGLYNTTWHGRFEQISKDPDVFIDGAHNEEAAISLRDSIEIYFTNRRLIFIIGVLADKDYNSILRILAPMANTIITLTPDNPRALQSARLAEVARTYCNRVLAGGDVEHALGLALAEAGKAGAEVVDGAGAEVVAKAGADAVAKAGADAAPDTRPVIIAFGSLSYLGDLVNVIRKIKHN